MKTRFVITTLAASLVLAGCNSSEESATEAPTIETSPSSLFTTNVADVSQCPNGGEVIDMGIDANGNNVLDASEVTASQVICNGQDGQNGLTPLVLVSPASSASCSQGGSVIRTGFDNDDDGQLTGDEVSAEALLCNGEEGSQGLAGNDGADGKDGTDGQDGVSGQDGADGLTPLIVTEAIAKGAVCANGGQRITSGVDANSDGVIDPATAAEAVLCNGTDAQGVGFTVANVVATEGEDAVFTVTLDRPAEQAMSLRYVTQNGVAQAGEDYVFTSGRVDFAEGETSQTIAVPTLVDTNYEPFEQFVVQVTGYAVLENAIATIQQPKVSFGDMIVDGSLEAASLSTEISIELSDRITNVAEDAIKVSVHEPGQLNDGMEVYGLTIVDHSNDQPRIFFSPVAPLAVNTNYQVDATIFDPNSNEPVVMSRSFVTEDTSFEFYPLSASDMTEDEMHQWLGNGDIRPIEYQGMPVSWGPDDQVFTRFNNNRQETHKVGGVFAFVGAINPASNESPGPLVAPNPMDFSYEKIWMTDGSMHGTFPLAGGWLDDLLFPTNLKEVGGVLYFIALNAAEFAPQIVVSDGTTEGSKVMVDLGTFFGTLVFVDYFVVPSQDSSENSLFVVFEDLDSKEHSLWQRDESGALVEAKVTDIEGNLVNAPTVLNGREGSWQYFNNALYYIGSDNKLYRSTSLGFELVDLVANSESLYSYIYSTGKRLLVRTSNNFYLSDGTAQGTELITQDTSLEGKLTEMVPEFWIQNIAEYDGKVFIVDYKGDLFGIKDGSFFWSDKLYAMQFGDPKNLAHQYLKVLPSGVVLSSSDLGGIYLFALKDPSDSYADREKLLESTGPYFFMDVVGEKLLYKNNGNYYISSLEKDPVTGDVEVLRMENIYQ
ncbi:DUF7151 family protein [Salinibius halmophilus]|uniref:DUF7151 family protein n=1 Tax=Salinibius halmophilus TaxID=1853216 RepID=UPI000E661458|nr:Calx-beta domain-containing protein [Salinibius halmophilus]